jgi:hypothetical protein
VFSVRYGLNLYTYTNFWLEKLNYVIVACLMFTALHGSPNHGNRRRIRRETKTMHRCANRNKHLSSFTYKGSKVESNGTSRASRSGLSSQVGGNHY